MALKNKIVLIDTNVLVRFLLADHPKLSLKAKNLFLRAKNGKIKMYLDEIVTAETIWLLSSFYKLDKNKIVTLLQEIVSQEWVINPRKEIILKALEVYFKNNLAYIDCWLCCFAKTQNIKLETFDHKLKVLTSEV